MFIIHVRISRDYGTIIHESALSEIYSGYLMSLLVTTVFTHKLSSDQIKHHHLIFWQLMLALCVHVVVIGFME